MGKLGEQEPFSKQKVLDKDPILFSLEKNLTNINKIVSKIISQGQIYNIPLEKPLIFPKWKSIPGRLSQIRVGADETILGISSKDNIYILKDLKWIRFPGKATNICLSDIYNIWGIGPKRRIFKWDPSKNKWIAQRGRGKYISCGFDGTVVLIHTDSDASKYQLSVGSMVILEKNKWKNFPGQLEKVAVVDRKNIWGIKKTGSVWHFDGEKWSNMPGEMQSISVAKDNTVVAVGLNGGAYIWSGNDWINVPGINLIAMETLRNGDYFALTSDGSVWRSMESKEEED